MSGPSKPLSIGVLIIPPVQLLDLSPIDLFGMLTPEYLKACNLPAPLLALGTPVTIHYITSTHQDLSPSSPTSPFPKPNPHSNFVQLTASAHILSTANLSLPAVQPGLLSTLLIPGPDPNIVPTDAEKAFIRAHYNAGTTDILTVCTGIFPAGYAGILDGHEVNGPRALVSMLRKKFPAARWVERRWSVSAISPPSTTSSISKGSDKHAAAASANGAERKMGAHLWTSGGITNGLDMVAAYLHSRQSVHGISTELADLVCRMADVGERKQEYDVGGVSEGGWWLLLILRSWWRGGVGKEKA